MTTRLRRAGNVATMPGLPDSGIGSHYVALLPNGPLIKLAGTASMIWEAAEDGVEDTLSERVADLLADVSAADVDADVRAFVDDLVGAGYLERYDPADGA
ncbi:hypothetical protein N865_09000 [Intrasporangium oryzae NRRL B-24470]|uniref:Pyrroloquinoline quinone biosynthesis protein PqqD n=1 Tax=Intrasporangium oryzae NRRL B-24470 TaxID=1386089 RepID=W9GEN8_9MICO|nr:PqqD family protein [Intrasporangium oryzae]EWT03687.1 hypothetical protein N865_09000 [Intrasporangium oryzae NRRL B-24470]